MSKNHKADDELFVENASQVLKESGGRITQPRLAVLRCLSQTSRPLSPREILEFIESDEESKNTDQVTVYRILEALVELGLVHRVGPEGQYIGCTHLHCGEPFHVLARCESCERMFEVDVPEEVFVPLREHLQLELGFQAKGHDFQLEGLCKNCQA